MVNFKEIEEGEPLLFRDRRNNKVYKEHVKFAGFAVTGHPVVEFEDGRRWIVLPEQLSYPQEDEYVNIRSDPDRYEIEGYEILERIPRHYSRQSSATLYLPLEWANKRVKVVRLDP